MARMGAEEAVQGQGTTKFKLKLDMHPAQQEIYGDPARFKVVAAGRRFGKSLLAAMLCLVVAWSKDDALVLWASPTHDQARKAMRTILRVLRQVPRRYWEVNRTTGEIYLNNGSIIMFRSAERFDNLRGDGLDFVVLDEAAFMPKEVWTQALRPALADKQGNALLISTFDGENWFYDLYRQACDPELTEWSGWRLPTSCNPYVPVAEIEEIRRTTPEDIFAQEFLASPLKFSGAVFPGERLDWAWKAGKEWLMPPAEAIVLDTGQMVLGRTGTEAGLDWGWNVTAMELCLETAEGNIVWFAEQIWLRVELREKCKQIAAICEQWNVEIIYADAAGNEENAMLAAILEETGAPTVVQPVPFAQYKRPGVVTRSYYLEREREIVTPACVQLNIDSRAYHYERSKDGIRDDKYAKGNDHTVDACTAFYASRSGSLADVLRDNAEEAA